MNGIQYEEVGRIMSRRPQPRSQNLFDEPRSQAREVSDPALLIIQYGMKNALELVMDMVPNCPTPEEKQYVIDRLEKLVLNLIRSEIAYRSSTEIIGEAGREIIPNDHNIDRHELLRLCDKMKKVAEERYKTREETITEENLKEHELYATYLETLAKAKKKKPDGVEGTVEDTNEESILTDESSNQHIPTIDPITKQKLVDPVRNTICQHVYGQAAILQLIKKNPKMRCPNMGCSNKDFIKAKHLQADPALTAIVQRKQAEQEDEAGGMVTITTS